MNDMHNFSKAKESAINEMRKMNKKAIHSERSSTRSNMPNQNKTIKNAYGSFGTTISDDDILIIGLLLVLSEDCRDTWLFLALVYILMG